MTGPRPLAVIGLGVIAKFYLAAIEADPSFTLAAVCDRDEAALARPRAAASPPTATTGNCSPPTGSWPG